MKLVKVITVNFQRYWSGINKTLWIVLRLNRNNVIYTYQENRNPFIDHPEYVDLIWTITSTEMVKESDITFYPNPAKDYVVIELPDGNNAKGGIYNLNGGIIKSFRY